MSEDLQSMRLEDLSARLEAIEKDNEQIKRENQLFQSFILRKTKDERKFEEDPDEIQRKTTKKKQKDRPDRQMKLTAEHKYDIANKELDTLKTNINEGREKSEQLLERLKAILEGTDLSIAEIRKEAFEFGRFLSAAENGRTGKYDAEKLLKHMEDKMKAKEALIDKLSLKNVSLKTQIIKADSQIKYKETMCDDLKFIDFHQLQIENKKHVKEIDERNTKLISLKSNSGMTVQTLNALQKKLRDANTMQEGYATEMETKTANREKTLTAISKTKEDIRKTNKKNRR